MSCENPSDLLVTQYNSKVKRVIQEYQQQNYVYLVEHPEYNGTIQDYIRYGNDMVYLNQFQYPKISGYP